MTLNRKLVIDSLTVALYFFTSAIALCPVAFVYVFSVLFLFSIPLLLVVNLSFLLFQSSIAGDASVWLVLFGFPVLLLLKMKQKILKMEKRHRLGISVTFIIFFCWIFFIYDVLSKQ